METLISTAGHWSGVRHLARMPRVSNADPWVTNRRNTCGWRELSRFVAAGVALVLILATASPPLLAQTPCSALAGKWSATASRPNGPTIATTVELSPDFTFKGTANVNGAP